MNNEDEKEPTEKGEGSKVEKIGNIVNKAKKIKTIGPIIAAIAPFIGWILLGGVVIVLLLVSVTYFSQIIEGVTTGLDKFINFVTLEGWNTSQNAFYKRLNDEYERYNAFANKEGEFDIPLIVSTIHYGTLVNPEAFIKSGNSAYNYDSKNPVVDSNNNTNFYILANDKLGSAFSVIPGDKKLIGHLIDVKFVNKCVSVPTGWDVVNLEQWKGLTGAITDAYDDLIAYINARVIDTTKSVLNRANTWALIRLIIADINEGDGLDTILADAKKTFGEIINANGFADLYRIIKQSDLTGTCTSGQIPLPTMTYFVNYDYYKQYLKNEYLPNEDYNKCDTCEWKVAADSTTKSSILDREISEIFAQRDAYRDLQGKSNLGITNFPFCSTGIAISTGSDAGVYNLEEYVAGVVSAENAYTDPNNPTNIESMKAQAVAARTYALSRTSNCTQPIADSSSAQNFTRNIKPNAKLAADETAGMVLTYKGKIFSSEYDAYKCADSCIEGQMCYCEYVREPETTTHMISVPTNFTSKGVTGHGRGMSQDAANYLQTQGYTYDQILKYFYADGIQITKAAGNENGTDGRVTVANGIFSIPSGENSGLSGSMGSGPRGLNVFFYQRLSAFFSAASLNGYTIGITDGWRSYDDQVTCRENKGSMCATPGKSMHGWGIAADLNFDSKAATDWAHAHAAEFGLDFAVCKDYFGGDCSEPWHAQPVKITYQ